MKRSPLRKIGFTLLELLTVMSIIALLAGLILAGVGYAQKKAAGQRASAEIAAFSAALESYKADNGEYPRTTLSSGTTSASDKLVTVPYPSLASAGYQQASMVLYQALSGGTDSAVASGSNTKVYFEFKADMLSTGTAAVSGSTYVIDPFGNSYGYATPDISGTAAVTGTNTNNPTFDLWSTNGYTTKPAKAPDVNSILIKNW